MEITFGICDLAIIPVRKQAAHSSELVTQLLFGDLYQVSEVAEDGKWLKIISDFDKYEGWIDEAQWCKVSEEYAYKYQHREHPVLTESYCYIESSTEEGQWCSIGAILPFYEEGWVDLESKKMKVGKGNAVRQRTMSGVDEMLLFAKQYLNAPYLWGGKSLSGIDCSAFVQQVFKAFGKTLLRDSSQQYQQGIALSLGEAEAGDLAFFTEKGKVTHVGLLISPNQVIHASGKVRVDRLDEKGIYHEAQERYTHELVGVRRV